MRISLKFKGVLVLLCVLVSACLTFCACAGGTEKETSDETDGGVNQTGDTVDESGESEDLTEFTSDSEVGDETSIPADEQAGEVISEFGCPELVLDELFYFKFTDPNNPDVSFRMQGGCFDGTNFYLAFVSHNSDKELSYIVALDKEGNEIQRSDSLKTGHSNGLSLYKDGTILVSKGNSQAYYIIDKATLTYLETKAYTAKFLSLDYCLETDEYVMLDEGHGLSMRHIDSSLTTINKYDLEIEEGTDGQNFFCTPDLIYSMRYKHVDGRYHNFLHINTWTAELKALYYMNISGDLEAQSVSVDGNTVYIPCGNYSSECIIYTAEINLEELQ